MPAAQLRGIRRGDADIAFHVSGGLNLLQNGGFLALN